MRQGVAYLAARWPYLARRNGTDHVWVSSHDAGHDFSVLADERLTRNGLAIANSADTDASIPSAALPALPASRPPPKVPPFDPSRDASERASNLPAARARCA